MIRTLITNTALIALTEATMALGVVIWDSRRPSECDCVYCGCKATYGECIPPCCQKPEPVELVAASVPQKPAIPRGKYGVNGKIGDVTEAQYWRDFHPIGAWFAGPDEEGRYYIFLPWFGALEATKAGEALYVYDRELIERLRASVRKSGVKK